MPPLLLQTTLSRLREREDVQVYRLIEKPRSILIRVGHYQKPMMRQSVYDIIADR
jgi:hypothetical protein